MRRRFKGLLSLIFILILGCLALGGLYFGYTAYLAPNGDIKVFGELSINYEDGYKLNIKGNKTTKISVINDSLETVNYYIEFKNIVLTDAVTYTITDNNGFNISDELNSYNTVVSSYLPVQPGEIKEFIFTFTSKSSSRYHLEINIEPESLETNTFSDLILKNNQVKEESVTKVGEEIATTNEGLIKSVDDYGTSYYFRGKIDNNNVRIGDLNFKILRINGDGSVKVVLSDTTGELKKYYDNMDEYGYRESNIYTYLNSWLITNLYEYTSLLVNQKYCNDISLNNNEFFSYNRIVVDKIPSFMCLGTKVSNKIGLLTVDEVMYAGSNTKDENTEYFLYNESIESEYYLMTGAKLDKNSYIPFTVSEKGKILYTTSGENYRLVRPVITIIKTAVVEGDGSIENPYVLTV